MGIVTPGSSPTPAFFDHVQFEACTQGPNSSKALAKTLRLEQDGIREQRSKRCLNKHPQNRPETQGEVQTTPAASSSSPDFLLFKMQLV